jgi:hypothetical protein
VSNFSKHELRKYTREEIAGYLVASALGSTFQSQHCGDSSDTFDCRIIKEDTPVIALEVTTDADPKYEELTSSLFSQPYGEALRLGEGSGCWVLHLTLRANVKSLTKQTIENLIQNCLSLSYTSVHIRDLRTNHPIKKDLNSLGIESLRLVNFESDIAYRLMPTSSGCIDDSEDLLADHLEGLLQETRISDKICRLILRADHLEPHLAILEGSKSGLSINFRMNGLSLSDPKPTRPIEIPQGLKRLWFICSSSSRAISYSNEHGWEDFDVVNDSSPWWSQVELPFLQELRSCSSEP